MSDDVNVTIHIKGRNITYVVPVPNGPNLVVNHHMSRGFHGVQSFRKFLRRAYARGVPLADYFFESPPPTLRRRRQIRGPQFPRFPRSSQLGHIRPQDLPPLPNDLHGPHMRPPVRPVGYDQHPDHYNRWDYQSHSDLDSGRVRNWYRGLMHSNRTQPLRDWLSNQAQTDMHTRQFRFERLMNETRDQRQERLLERRTHQDQLGGADTSRR